MQKLKVNMINTALKYDDVFRNQRVKNKAIQEEVIVSNG